MQIKQAKKDSALLRADLLTEGKIKSTVKICWLFIGLHKIKTAHKSILLYKKQTWNQSFASYVYSLQLLPSTKYMYNGSNIMFCRTLWFI